MFQQDTESRLKKKQCIDRDRKYMVQTLATMMMTPSLKDCQVVSTVLHKKFSFLGDEGSEVCLILSLLLC